MAEADCEFVVQGGAATQTKIVVASKPRARPYAKSAREKSGQISTESSFCSDRIVNDNLFP